MIQLRWVNRWTLTNPATSNVLGSNVKVLQYRQKSDYANLPKNFDNKSSDWQDVGVESK